tara:strand:+ start:3649 stop:4218 length:570 start_codon:yes stop_codon:yes gene_type:complete
MIENKRGLSAVVAVLLILLLTVTAVVIIAGFIIPFVGENLEGSTECLDYQGYFSFEEVFESSGEDFRYNCYDVNKLHGLSIRTKNVESSIEEGIIGFDLLFVKGGISEKVEVRDGVAADDTAEGIRMLDKSLTDLEVSGAGGIRTYVYNATEIFEKIEVYPVLTNKKPCEMSDSIKIRLCEENINLEVE